MNKNPIIAYLTHSITYGGATQSLLLMQKAMGQYKNEKHLLYKEAVNEKLLNEFRPVNNNITKISIPRIDYNQTTKISFFRFIYRRHNKPILLVKYLIENKIEILHINTSVFSGSLKYIKENSGVKIITHVREFIAGNKQIIIKNYIINQIEKYSDVIIAISPNEAGCFKNRKNVIVIPNPFDFEHLDINPIKEIKDSVIRIGMIANFSRSKGILEFLKAINVIIKTGLARNEFKASIIGIDLDYRTPVWKRIIKALLFKKNYQEEVLNYIRNNNLVPVIDLVPFTSTPLKELYKLDIVVRPSKGNDPWGRDIIEAMALKKPVVATGSSDFYVKNGETGYLVPTGNAKDLAEKISILINDADKRQRFGKIACSRVRELCDLYNYGEKINSIYSLVINGNI